MSYCSTEVMKQKLGYVLRWEIDDPNDNMAQTTEVEVNDRRFISEQRYQQLEQVARELNSCLYKALMRPDGVPPDGLIDEAEYLSYRLIRLGVSLDG